MAVGETKTGSLADSLPTMIADARIVREFEGVWQRTTDSKRLREGTGTTWNEISLAGLEASDITETTINNNPQQVADTILTGTPQMVQIMVKITDRTYRRIADVVESKIGTLAGNAMARKKDDDYTTLFATFGTGASPGAGQPISFGHISAAVNRTTSNRTEPATGNVYTILRGEQIYDIQQEITAGIGTYTVPNGMTEQVFKSGFRGSVSGSHVFEDGDIAIGASGAQDARGGTHARDGASSIQ